MKEIIINYFINHNYISEEYRDIYYYGLYVIQLNVLTDLIVLFLSLWLNQFLFGIVFLLSFNCIRIYWGGLHANHPLSCFISFMIIYIINVFIFNKYQIDNIIIYYLILTIIYFVPSIQTKDIDTIKRNDTIKKKMCILFYTFYC